MRNATPSVIQPVGPSHQQAIVAPLPARPLPGAVVEDPASLSAAAGSPPDGERRPWDGLTPAPSPGPGPADLEKPHRPPAPPLPERPLSGPPPATPLAVAAPAPPLAAAPGLRGSARAPG